MLLKIYSEGQTEQEFVTQILRPHLERFGYSVSAVVNPTSPGSRGGLSHYQQFKTNAKRIRKSAPDCLLTTMIDLYGLPNDFPGMENIREIIDPYEKVAILEKKLDEDLALENFIPYIQLHEFEALLFSDIEKIDQVISRDQPSKRMQLQKILDHHHSPEEIDHNKGPSCYLREICGNQHYSKILWGIEIAKKIDLPIIRDSCPHFHHWLAVLEQYADEHR